MTTTLISPIEALDDTADQRPDDVTEVIRLLADWLSAAATTERAIRYDQLIDSMYEWLEASDGTRIDALLASTIRRAEIAQDHLLRSTESAPFLF